MSQGLKLELLGKLDRTTEKNEYYFTRPNLPVLVDLSKCVIFVHPYENEDGSFGAEIVFKNYYPPKDKKFEE
jgi:hypothetical protein